MPKPISKTLRFLFNTAWIISTLLALTACHSHKHSKLHGYVESRFTFLASPEPGKLVNLWVKRGDPVNQGSRLFQIDNTPQQADVDAAVADVQQAQANLANLEKGQRPSELDAIQSQINAINSEKAFAQKEVHRYRALVKDHHAAQRDFDQALRNLQSLDSQVKTLRAHLTTAKLPARSDEIQVAKDHLAATQAHLHKMQWALAQTLVKAPRAGYVYDTFYRLGEIVPSGQPVVALTVPNETKVVFFVSASHLSQLSVGQTVAIYCDSCSKSLPATIQFISDQAEYTPPVIYSEQSREKLVYRVEAYFNSHVIPASQAPFLHPGQPVDIAITSSLTHTTHLKK